MRAASALSRAMAAAAMTACARVMGLALAACAACAALVACGGGGSGASTAPALAPPASCSVADQRVWLRNYMTDQYFWYANMGTPDESAASMDAYFQSLLYKPTDRYSYTQPTAQFDQFYDEGSQTGYGYSLAFTDATTLRVRYVEPAGPVAAAGLARGETVLSIDGFTPAQIGAGALASVTTEGVPRGFVVRSLAGVTRSFTVSSAKFPLTPVLASRVFDVALAGGGTAKVGYLLYQQFIASGNGALGAAIDAMRAAGATRVVLDLRYNGGGSTTVARALASMAGGSALAGSTFVQFRYNDKLAAGNFAYGFTDAGLPAAPLDGLQRIVFITSGSTASASELVINGLKPFKPVTLVGATTYGKPYAFQPRDACGTTYNAVNLEGVNAAGAGGFSNGIAPDCVVPDDLDHALGDASEGRLAAALSFVATGACPSALAAPAAAAGRIDVPLEAVRGQARVD